MAERTRVTRKAAPEVTAAAGATKDAKSTTRTSARGGADVAAQAAERTRTPAKTTRNERPAAATSAATRSSAEVKAPASRAAGETKSRTGATGAAVTKTTAAKATKSATRKTAAKKDTGPKAATKVTTSTATGAKVTATKATAKKAGGKKAGEVAGATRASRTRRAAVPPADTAPVAGGSAAPARQGRSAEEAEAIREALSVRRDELRAEYEQTIIEIAELQRDRFIDSAGDDQADTGTKTFEREQEISLANGILERITQVERALERLDDGRYGWCERCGNAIPVERLAAFPSATLCVSCKQLEERR